VGWTVGWQVGGAGLVFALRVLAARRHWSAPMPRLRDG
jgi:hypothetical protein